MRVMMNGVALLAVALAGCGSNTVQRAATGGLTGAGAGALFGGPVGFIVGAVAGAAGGALVNEGVDQMAKDYYYGSKQSNAAAPVQSGSSQQLPSETMQSSPPRKTLSPRTTSSTSASVPIAPDLARQMQTVLKDEQLYDGPIDGIVGPRTRRALLSYSAAHGDSGAIDLKTMQTLTGQEAPEGSTQEPAGGSTQDQGPK